MKTIHKLELTHHLLDVVEVKNAETMARVFEIQDEIKSLIGLCKLVQEVIAEAKLKDLTREIDEIALGQAGSLIPSKDGGQK